MNAERGSFSLDALTALGMVTIALGSGAWFMMQPSLGANALATIAEAAAAMRDESVASTTVHSVFITFNADGTETLQTGPGGACGGCFLPDSVSTLPVPLSSNAGSASLAIVANIDGRLIAGDPAVLGADQTPPPCPQTPVTLSAGGATATVQCAEGMVTLDGKP